MNKILIVDDDEDFLEILGKSLQKNEFQVQTISKISDVFIKVDEMKPDLILLDIHLSGFDGRDICKALKSHSKTKNIPVIMVSSDSSKLAQVQQSGADDFIEKPFELRELLDLVRLHLPQEVSDSYEPRE